MFKYFTSSRSNSANTSSAVGVLPTELQSTAFLTPNDIAAANAAVVKLLHKGVEKTIRAKYMTLRQEERATVANQLIQHGMKKCIAMFSNRNNGRFLCFLIYMFTFL